MAIARILLARVLILLHELILCGKSSRCNVLLNANDLGSTAPNNDVTPG